MIKNLKVLKGELIKVESALMETKPRDYKRYATLYQTYIGLTNVVNQAEAMEKQEKEEKRKEEERQKILRGAEVVNKAEESDPDPEIVNKRKEQTKK